MVDLRALERDKRIRSILTSPESIQESQRILETVWDRNKTPDEELKELIQNYMAKHLSLSNEEKKQIECIIVEVSKLSQKLDNKDSKEKEQWVSITEVKDLIKKGNNENLCILILSSANMEGINNMHSYQQSQNYQSRYADIENIWRYMPEEWNRDVVQLVIVGEEGVGKTQIVIEFLKMHKKDFGLIWWINAVSKSQIEASYMKIAEELGILSASLHQAEIVKQIILSLERQRNKWLLIFDNAKNFDVISEFIPKANGAVLITSRNEKWKGNVYKLSSYEEVLSLNDNSNALQEEIQPTAPSSQERVSSEPVTKNMQVVIRIRPLNNKENEDVVTVDNDTIKINDWRNNESKVYTFDKIFRDTDNNTIFMNTAYDLIQPALSGINACFLAYGATGSGKTYTMTGTADDPGIIPLTIHRIFDKIQSDTDKVYNVKISYVQIYNEKVSDLLSENPANLDVRSDKKETKICGAEEIEVKDSNEAMWWISTGNERRVTQETGANKTSSRSHAVLILEISQREKGNADTIFHGKFLLVDLAGSEGNVSNNKTRKQEGANINKSLLALCNLIEALASKQNYSRQSFIKYRDSKLTRILEGCLGGNCKNVMISNISPASSQYQESASTLYISNRAQVIKGKVQANKNFYKKDYKEYEKMISDLKTEIESLKNQCNIYLVSNQQALSDKERLYKDETEMKNLKDEISENFQKWFYLKKELATIEEQESDIKMKQAQILKWIKEEEEGQPENSQSIIDSIKEQYREIQIMKSDIVMEN